MRLARPEDSAGTQGAIGRKRAGRPGDAWLESIRAAFEVWLLARWFNPDPARADLLARLCLQPLARLTRLLAARKRLRIRHLRPETRPAIVVIGNLVAGGAGKTPLVAAIARALAARGWQVGILARGHRAALRHARLVGPHDDAHQQGDEPVLLARTAQVPVACGIDRGQALALLMAGHRAIDVVLSDDGLQHAGLPRTLEIVVFDDRGAGNGQLLPAGPLREPLAHLAQMNALLLRASGPGTESPDTPFDAAGASLPRFRFAVAPVCFRQVGSAQAPTLSIPDFRALAAGRRVHAMAGIARPQRFFDSLHDCGIAVQSRNALSDHAPVRTDLLPANAELIVMTAKDAVKFTGMVDARCWYLEVAAHVDPAFIDWLEASLRGSPTH